jgi:hypothetical protein
MQALEHTPYKDRNSARDIVSERAKRLSLQEHAKYCSLTSYSLNERGN